MSLEIALDLNGNTTVAPFGEPDISRGRQYRDCRVTDPNHETLAILAVTADMTPA